MKKERTMYEITVGVILVLSVLLYQMHLDIVNANSYINSSYNEESIKKIDKVSEPSFVFLSIKTDIVNTNKKMNEKEAEMLAKKIIDTAIEKNISPQLFAALIHVESKYNNSAKSHAGAIGLGQLTPICIKQLGYNINPYNVDDNLRASAEYLKKMLEEFENNKELALAAYNAGPTAVKNTNGIPDIKETKDYILKIDKVLNYLYH